MPTQSEVLNAIDSLSLAQNSQSQRQRPASLSSLDNLKSTMMARFGVVLPEDLLEFLSLTDGYNYDGVFIWGSATKPHLAAPKIMLNGIVEANVQLRSTSQNASHLVLVGAMDDFWLAWLPAHNSYAWVDPCAGRDETIRRFSAFETMFVETMMTRVNVAGMLSGS